MTALWLKLTLQQGANDRRQVLVRAGAITAIAEDRDEGAPHAKIYIGETHPIRVRETLEEISAMFAEVV